MLLISPLTAADEKSAGPVKVLCWNIHHGVGVDGKLDLARIAGVIRARNPDVVALQEVDRNCQRSGAKDQAAILAEMTGMKHAFGEAMPFQGGSYGQAILSKHPMGPLRVVKLSEEGEPRIAIAAEITHPVGIFTLVGTHLDHRGAERRLSEVSVLLKDLEKTTGPVVLCGDFNDVPGSPVIGLFKEPWSRVEMPGHTSPAAEPKRTIDHFFRRGFVAAAVEVLGEAMASDHRPIIADFTFPAPAGN